MRVKGQRVQGQQHQCFTFARFDLGRRIGRPPSQGAQRGAVQVFQQLALPCVPYLGAGAPYIGDRQQIQGCQLALITHAAGKRGNHVRIAQILLLSHGAHGEVFAHQKLDQLAVVTVHAMLATKAPGFLRTDLGVVSASAFANVMEQRGKVQRPGLVPATRKLRAKRVFVRMLGHEEAAHIAQHHQNVLIYRVDVKQVMLHLSHDAAKGPEVTPQHRCLVHEPHGMGDARGLLQDAHERGAVDRVTAKLAVHHAPRVVERTQGTRRQVFEARGRFVQQKRLQDGVWLAGVEVVTGHFHQTCLVQKTCVDGARLFAGGVQAVFNIEQKNLAQL